MEDSIALITGLVLFAAAVVGLITRLMRKVDEVHVMVNSRMEEAINQNKSRMEEAINQNKLGLERIDQLVEALQAAGVKIPDTPDPTPNSE